ncbi:MAG TPA: isoprenylcysteine carboxylmethyltransferase family protein [Candidatus Paceibacterota bacterium]|jgi:protein-S-isoprenylcysteine O-methyltransferase Ste14|nr:isoprenylcysteine carboxylmethyltransferase family protein [Candidatus Paceibacterota bacterium]
MTHDFIFSIIIGICWLVFIVYWFISSLKAKKTIRRSPQGIWFRVILIVVFISFFLVPAGFLNTESPFPLKIVGIIFVVLGISLAIWARVHLGKNWGMPMSLKESPELVTSGPYRTIRNPIYTGVIFAVLGSALVTGFQWFIIFLVVLVYFIYSTKQEEKIMEREFGEKYLEYKKHTKALIPFIW